jgi:hypothetical protein
VQVVSAADFDEPLTDFDDARDQQAPTRDPPDPPCRTGQERHGEAEGYSRALHTGSLTRGEPVWYARPSSRGGLQYRCGELVWNYG